MTSILEACDYHGPYPGNFIPSLLATGAAVRERLGVDYRCAFPEAVRDRPWVEMLAEHGIEHTFLPPERARRLRELRSFAAAGDTRLIRSHFTAWDPESAVVARALGARTIWNVHTGNLEYGLRRRAADLVKVRMLGHLCDRVIAVSTEVGRELRMRGFPDRKVSVVLNGIDISRFAAARIPDRDTARAQLELPPASPVVLAFCWTPYRKGADIVARAGAALAAAGTEAIVLMVGGQELVEYLEANVGPRPEWLRVVAPADDPGALFAAADVFVSASREEAFSYAIGEAMSAGLPVVSSEIPGPAAYFGADGVTTYPAEDSGALADALAQALATPPAAVAAANRSYVAEHLALDRHVDRVIAIFEHELASARVRTR